MKITVDTKMDSMEEIRFVANLLNSMLGKGGNQRRNYSADPYASPVRSPFDQPQSPPQTDFWGNPVNSSSSSSTQSSGYSNYNAYPSSQQQAAPSPAAQDSLFSIFGETPASQAVAPEPQKRPEDEIRIIEY